ncbi:MAG: hypothetical protein JW912_01845 [Sedimentisphaerales bacterium]|nr:hypothetical protein [Sedimentisphaerales bacterium]
MGKQPAFQFYIGDWLKDTALRCCSPAARGIWIDILCMMYEAPQRGVLRTKKGQKFSAISIKILSNSIAGCTPKLIRELIDNGVVRVARKDGALYSKRMVRDELHRRHKAINGQKGGKQKPSKPKANRQANPGSSSSSSTSVNNITTNTTTTHAVASKSPPARPPDKSPTVELKNLVKTWNTFAKQKANAEDIGIEYAYTQAVARWGCEAVLGAIENYRQALLLPHSQAWDRPLGKLFLDIKKFIPGIFNLNNFDKTNFKDGKNAAHKRDTQPGSVDFR